MKKMGLFSFLIIILGAFSCEESAMVMLQDSRVIKAKEGYWQAYRFSPLAPASKHFSVLVNDSDYYVYPVPLVGRRLNCCSSDELFEPEIVSFGIGNKSKVTLLIKSKADAINSFEVRPKRKNNVSYTVSRIDANTLELTVVEPQSLSVEINDNIGAPLLVFANTIENSLPDKKSCAYYFEEGGIYDVADNTVLKSGNTVYVAPGAIVRGGFETEDGAINVTVAGRGIISGENIIQDSDTPTPTASLMKLKNAADCTIEGVTFVNSKNWTIPLFGCFGVTIDGIRIVSGTGYEDGIDLVGSSYINVRNSFIYTKDDCITVKAGVNYNWVDRGQGIDGTKDARNINVSDCVIWNGSDGNALEIGCELNTNTIEQVKYENIDIIHAQCPCGLDEGALSIDNDGKATVRNVTYSNIYLENVERYFINIKIDSTVYSPGGRDYLYGDSEYVPGKVENITYENIFLDKKEGSPIHSAMIDSFQIGNIKNVAFKNFYINNNPVTSAAGFDLLGTDQFVLVTGGVSDSDITFE